MKSLLMTLGAVVAVGAASAVRGGSRAQGDGLTYWPGYRARNVASEDLDDPWIIDKAIVAYMRSQGYPSAGLNADWSVTAFHLGPSGVPNTNDGDFYLVENDDGSWEIVQRFYMDEDKGEDNDRIESVELYDTFDKAAVGIENWRTKRSMR